MRASFLLKLGLVSALVITRQKAQAAAPSCPHSNRYDYSEKCLGGLFVSAGADRWLVRLDGQILGTTPLVVEGIDPAIKLVELLAKEDALPVVAQKVAVARGRIASVRLPRKLQIAPQAELPPLTSVRFGMVDECDGFLPGTTPHSSSLASRELQSLRERRRLRPADRSQLPLLADLLPWNERACTAGSAQACEEASVILLHDLTLTKRRADGVRYGEQACKLGLVSTCQDLAQRYDVGDLVPQDDQRAIELLERACALGAGPSCHRLGFKYAGGPLPVQDAAKSAASFARGCKLGYGPSCTAAKGP